MEWCHPLTAVRARFGLVRAPLLFRCPLSSLAGAGALWGARVRALLCVLCGWSCSARVRALLCAYALVCAHRLSYCTQSARKRDGERETETETERERERERHCVSERE